MSADKNPSIFSRQMKAIVYILALSSSSADCFLSVIQNPHHLLGFFLTQSYSSHAMDPKSQTSRW